MFDASLLGESRPAFTARLDDGNTFQRWVTLVPRLACGGDVDSIADVFAELAPSSRITHHDTLLSGLLQLAAQDGADDDDAVLAVLHAMQEGVCRLAGQRYEVALVLSELTVRIRTFPWRTRTRAIASNLLRGTEFALSCQENHSWMRTRNHVQRVSENAGGLIPLGADNPAGEDDDLDLIDLLLWAERTGVVDARGLSMLVEYHVGRDATGSGHDHVARLFGVTPRTSKRQCTAASEALRKAVPQYLAS